MYGATPLGEALCCDVTLVALTREGRPQPSAASRDGAAITVAERQCAAYPELLRPGPQRLCVLACEVGGRWSSRAPPSPARSCRPAPCGQAGLAAPLVGFLERGFAKHTCCHAARGAVRRWRTAWCPAPAAGGHTARRSPSHPKPPRPVVRRLHGDPDFLSCRRQKGVREKNKVAFSIEAPRFGSEMSLCIGAIETWPIPQLLRLDPTKSNASLASSPGHLVRESRILPVMRSLAADSPHLIHSACPCLLALKRTTAGRPCPSLKIPNLVQWSESRMLSS